MRKITLQKMNKIVDKIANTIDKYYKITFIVIFLLALFLNTYKFGTVPAGVDVDEAGMGYDAYCIANYGTDRYQNKFPVYFINFGDGQNALYIYLASILVKFFGLNNYIIRIPALILSMLEVIIAYFLVKDFKSRKMGLLFMFLVTILPWHIMKSRWSLESYLLSPMLLFSVYSLLKAVQKNKWYLFAISGLLFGVTLYSYAISYFTIPIFLLITFIYFIKKKMINAQSIIIFSIPLIILATPLILLLMVQKGIINPIHTFISIPILPAYKESIINIQNIGANLYSARQVFWDDMWEFNTIKGYGTLYHFSVLLLITGFIITITSLLKMEKKDGKLVVKINRKNDKTINLNFIMIIYFLSNIIWAFLIDSSPVRLNGVYISVTYFILIALQFIYRNIKLLFSLLIIFYITSLIFFTSKYYTLLAIPNISLFDNGIVNLTKHLEKYGNKDMYVEPVKKSYWIFEAYAVPISPKEFSESITLIDTRTLTYDFGKYHNSTIDMNQIQDDCIYVTEDKAKVEIFKEQGFSEEIYDKYYIFYK